MPTATTYYKKHKISKGETIAQSLKERFDYGQNPDKTEGGELISSYGCDHMTADAEFLLSKAKYKAATGREQRRDADVLCYQIRQSFKPGEITPEEANRIGYETAMRWTKGKYQFFVCTHIDKEHILRHPPLCGLRQQALVPHQHAEQGHSLLFMLQLCEGLPRYLPYPPLHPCGCGGSGGGNGAKEACGIPHSR